MLELKIAEFEEQVIKNKFGNWRFVLAKEGDTISLYANAPKGDSYGHSMVVADNNLDRSTILGGGDISYMYGILSFNGFSGDFGIVPNSIMDQFAELIDEACKEKYNIEKVDVNMWYDPGESERKNPEHLAMWRDLGYEFDCRRELE